MDWTNQSIMERVDTQLPSGDLPATLQKLAVTFPYGPPDKNDGYLKNAQQSLNHIVAKLYSRVCNTSHTRCADNGLLSHQKESDISCSTHTQH